MWPFCLNSNDLVRLCNRILKLYSFVPHLFLHMILQKMRDIISIFHSGSMLDVLYSTYLVQG